MRLVLFVALLLPACKGASDVYDAGHEAAVESLKGEIEALREQVAVLEAAASETQTEVAELDGRTGVLELDAADHEARLSSAEAALMDDAAALMDLDERVGAVEADYLVAASLEPYARTEDLGDHVRIGFASCLLGEDPDYDAAPEDCVLDIPGEYGTFEDAMAVLEKVRIPREATAVIRYAPETYPRTAPIRFHHPDGARIHIVGEPSDPGLVKLTFAGASGLVLTDGAVLGRIAGLTLVGKGASGVGISTTRGALVTCGDGVVVKQFEHGVLAQKWSSVVCDGLVTEANVHEGVQVATGSTFQGDGVIVRQNGRYGVYVVHDSLAILGTLTAEDNVGVGVVASQGSYVYSNGDVVNATSGARGFTAQWGSVFSANGAEYTGKSVGFTATHHSYMDAGGSVVDTAYAAGHQVTNGSGMRVSGSTSTGEYSLVHSTAWFDGL